MNTKTSPIRQIDSKGRLSIPPNLIDELDGEHKRKIVLVAIDNYIRVLSWIQWSKLQSDLRSSPDWDKNATVRAVIRRLARRRQICERDTQGRIRVSEDLKEIIGIKKKVLIIEGADGPELWDPDVYDEWESGQDPLESQIQMVSRAGI